MVVITANADAVNARKSFQPEAEMHVEIEFRATCAPDVARRAARRSCSSVRCRTATR
jgi:hypothetical protein